MCPRRLSIAICLLASVLAGSASAELAAEDLTSLSLDELAQVEVTIVTKRRERVGGAAAAVTVISNEELRRSGVTALPEAFRLSPGLHVARATSTGWAVSSRGFGSVNSAKLLVLVDGRSVYTPLFSGVMWDVQDTLLEDIDRIEIVRGPGASVWGAGAMNGVINILTRSAKQTQGSYVEAGGGTLDRGFASVRQGGKIGSGFFYRVFAKVFDRAPGHGAPADTDDRARMGRVGMRVDAEPGSRDLVTLQADAYMGEVGLVRPSLSLTSRPPPTGRLETDLQGGNVLLRWTRTFSETGDLTVRSYYDRTHRGDPTFHDDLDTFDVDLQNRFGLPGGHELIWGASYRLMSNHFRERGIIDIRPPRSRDHLWSGFVQDTASLLDDRLRITLGSKLEHNEFSGLEVEPSLRAAADLTARQTLWAATSRAVRVPTRFERDIFGEIATPPPMPLYRLLGSRDLASEKLTAVEVGHRWQATPQVAFDQNYYYHHYTSLITFELGTPFMEGAQRIQPITYKNKMHGRAIGSSFSVNMTPMSSWSMGMSYSYVRVKLTPEEMDINNNKGQERTSPRHQLALRSLFDLPGGLQLSAYFRFVDGVQMGPMPAQRADAYATADARLAWRPWKPLELSVVGQNLLFEHHREFPGGTEVSRSVYGKLAASF